MNRQERRKVDAKKSRLDFSRLNHLPLPASYVNHLSLANHLSLEACCVGDGNKAALNRMSSVLYLCYLIWETEGGPDHLDEFRAAGAALDAAVCRAAQSDVWRLESADRMALAALLSIHDGQLASISTRAYVSAAE